MKEQVRKTPSIIRQNFYSLTLENGHEVKVHELNHYKTYDEHYNSSGQLVLHTYPNSESQLKEIYQYDEKDLLSCIINSQVINNQELVSKIIFKYDRKDRPISEEHIYTNGKTAIKIQKTYNEWNDLLMEECHYAKFRGKSGFLINKLTVYSWDSSSPFSPLLMNKYEFNQDRFEGRVYAMEYDPEGRMVKRKCNALPSLNELYFETFEYNRHGALIKLSFESDDETKVTTYDYDYDEFDNWTSQKTFVNNIQSELIERTLKYQ